MRPPAGVLCSSPWPRSLRSGFPFQTPAPENPEPWRHQDPGEARAPASPVVNGQRPQFTPPRYKGISICF